MATTYSAYKVICPGKVRINKRNYTEGAVLLLEPKHAVRLVELESLEETEDRTGAIDPLNPPEEEPKAVEAPPKTKTPPKTPPKADENKPPKTKTPPKTASSTKTANKDNSKEA